MRITIHLDTFDCPGSAYAIIWLDREAGEWSREGHAAIDLPEWGTLVFTRGGTRLRAQEADRAICELRGLDLTTSVGPLEGGSGRALWYKHAHRTPIKGQWHIQCVDNSESQPENSVFSNGDT